MICQDTTAAVLELLLDADAGLNAWVARLAAQRSLPVPEGFPLPTDAFRIGEASPLQIRETTAESGSLCLIGVGTIQDVQENKGFIFNGSVNLPITLSLRTGDSSVQPVWGAEDNVIRDALVMVFGAADNWPSDGRTSYLGRVRITMDPLVIGGESWIRTIRADLPLLYELPQTEI
jgi:hypothetical protein